MKLAFSTSIVLALSAASVSAQGCNSDHYNANAEPVTIEEQLTASATQEHAPMIEGEMSVASVDCSVTPEAPQCLALGSASTN